MEGKIDGSDGHQEIELALGIGYESTGNRKYLDLSAYFLEVRGQNPHFLRSNWKKMIASTAKKGRSLSSIPSIIKRISPLSSRIRQEGMPFGNNHVYIFTGGRLSFEL